MKRNNVIAALLVGGLLVGVAFSAAGAQSDVNTADTQINQNSDCNNPGMIVYNASFPGVVQNYNGFAVFATVDDGILAIKQLLLNYFSNGIKTIQAIANKWTNNDPNAATNYLYTIGEAPMYGINSGLTVNSDVSAMANDPQNFSYLIAAITINEGVLPYSASAIQPIIS
jgi:hypothetical protein